jgi:ribosome biogenesis GTPase
MIGRIYKIAGNDCEVRSGDVVLHCRYRGKLRRERQAAGKLAAVGDEVEVTDVEAGEGVIEKVLPRRSKFSRQDAFRPSMEQVIVANLDALIVVQSARDPDFNPIVADKCTVMAAANRLPCVLCVNKIDLGRPDVSAYERAGFACIRTSARTGEGLEDLRKVLRGRTSMFLGPSGVGKTSLLNTMEPGLGLKVGDVSRRGEGRHTTSWVELLPAAGGLAADTPGLEFFTLWGVTADNLRDMFLDFVDLADGCRFRNCSHTREDGCAVKGRVAPSRYRSYLEILGDLRDRRDVFARK